MTNDTGNTETLNLGELFDEYEDKGCDFFDSEYLIKEGEEYAENDLEMNPHARLIMYSLAQELKETHSKIDKVKNTLIDHE
jgi:hypothetical protein